MNLIAKMKKKLGMIKRGLLGIIENNLEKNMEISSDITSEAIGYSVNKKEIKCYKIGRGKFKILFVGGTHGNEVGTVKLCSKLVNWLSSNISKYERFTFFIIPCLNLDGYLESCKNPDYWHGGSVGRFNANKVDLNRNFDTPNFQPQAYWAHGKKYQEKSEVFSGEKPFSEPETKALADLIQIEKTQLVFAFHNAGKDVIADKDSQKLAHIFSDASGYKFESDAEWNKVLRSGTFKEWCEIKKIAFIETEGSSRWGSDWRKHQTGISAILDSLSNGKID